MTKLKKFLKNVIKTDELLDRQAPIFVLLVLVLLLRIPNLFEPYWYGDEGIYLTIGQTLNKGAKLYSEIIDHKTPIIYYLARVHTQMNFRILNIAWMLVTTTAFYYFAQKLLKSIKQTSLATLIFVLLTTLPWFEGNIPNGELFVLGFVMVGAIVLSKTNYFNKFLDPKFKLNKSKKQIKRNYLYLATAGVLFGLGIMTKVPALFDLAVFMSIGYFSFVNELFERKFKENLKYFWYKFVELALIFTGALLPILFSIVYFVSVGSGKAYLDFGLLYNFRYAANWELPFASELLRFFFTLQGKLLILAVLVLLVSLLKRHFKPASQFIMTWFGLALFASLLSNRPYPHYFIQVVPPLALLLTLILRNKYAFIRNIFKSKPAINFSLIWNALFQTSLVAVFVATMILLDFAPYSTTKYYKNWYQLVTHTMSLEDYRQSFDYLMTDNYKAAEIIKNSGEKDLFIWGTNPMLYALSQAQPTGRFTVSFHIKDFDAYGETARDVVKKKPLFIIVMNNEDSEFEEFKSFLSLNYLPNSSQFEHFTLWKRRNDNLNN